MRLHLCLISCYAAWAQYVGIGTASPTHTVHVSGGATRIEGLSGTGLALVGLSTQGVTFRLDFSGNAVDFLRGDGTWGEDPGDWNLTGNAGTTPTIHYLGTTDATQFSIRTANAERMRFFVDGRILIGTTSPLSSRAILQVDGGNTHRAIYGYKASSNGTSVVLGIATQGGPYRAGAWGIGQGSDGVGLVGMAGVTDFVHFNLGPGINGTSPNYGVVAYAENTSGDRAAGRFEAYANSSSQIIRTLVAAYIGGTLYKIYGVTTGGGTPPAVSTLLADSTRQYHALFAPEAPEILFMDRGEATLENGTVYVPIDSVFSFNLYVTEDNPLFVFLQPVTSMRGTLYVTERSRQGFWIRSTDPTDRGTVVWWLVAHRNDTYTDQGQRLSRHVGVRLPKAPAELVK